jgi:hypothetical protein
MAVKYSKWPQKIPTSSIARPYKIYPNWDFRFEKYHLATLGRTGVDVIITIFCDFCQFLAKKLAFFSKNQCCDQNFAIFCFVLSKKRQFFRIFFGENI